jgi:hypothetical protein
MPVVDADPVSQASRRRRARAIAALGALAAGIVLSLRELADFDLPGHLAFGRLVVEHRGLVRIDELTCTARPVGYAEYISDVFLYGVARGFGPLGLQVLGGVLAVLIAGLLVVASRRGGIIAFAVVALAMMTMQPWLLVRPATASFALLALLLVAMDTHLLGTRRVRLYWLAPLFAAWANIHGFVVIGLAVLLGYAAYTLLCRVAQGRLGALAPKPHGRDASQVAIVAALSLGASMINPAGPRLLTGPLRASRDFGHIAEWATTTLSFLVREAPLAGVVAALSLVALVWGGDPASESRARRLPTLLDIGFVVLAFVLGRSAVRMVPIGAILVTPVIARRLGARLPAGGWHDLAFPFATWFVAPWMLAASPASRGVGFDPAHFSEGSIDYVTSARPSGQMYNSLPLGGWLDWRLFPAYRTFMDNKQVWVEDALLSTYYASESEPHAFDELSSRFDFQWAVVIALEGSTFATPIARSPAWAMVYWDDVSAVYVRTNGPNAKLAGHSYRLLRHLSSPESVFLASLARDDTAKALAEDVLLAESQAPDSPRAAFLAGCGAIARRDEAALHNALEKLNRLAPGHPGVGLLKAGWKKASGD